MTITKKQPIKYDVASSAMLLTAAMALPGINTAHAETAPEHGLISFKYLDYQDRLTCQQTALPLRGRHVLLPKP